MPPDWEFLSKTEVKSILSVDPHSFEKKKEKLIQKKLIDLINFNPDYIEVNRNLSDENIEEIINIARKKGVGIQLALYLMEETPDDLQLETIINEMLIFNPDIIKIVLNLDNEHDSFKYLRLYKEFIDQKLVILSTSNSGKISQILAPFLGAIYTCGFLSRKSDEAQLSIGDLKKIHANLIQVI